MKLKVLEICIFSEGVDGVWQRVKQESSELSKKGCQVKIFSSNFIKGSEKRAKPREKFGKIEILRFSAKKLGGESFMKFNFNNQALAYKPDIIIAHSYRHLHTSQALKIGKKINAKVFLVTHAPFIEKNHTRNIFGKLAVYVYDKFIAPKLINRFDKIIAITNWEIPYLLKLGAERKKIVYIPNGIPQEFFNERLNKFNSKKVVFLGRISPVKNLETLVKAFKILNNNNLELEIIGPIEKGYNLELGKNIRISKPIYNLNDKIKKLQEADIFVLPSLREAMPQSLIEALALGKIVISSKTQGGKEIVEDKKNGFLFEIGNEKELAKIISFCLDKKNRKLIERIRKNARKSAECYNWNKLIDRLVDLIHKP